MKRSGGNRRRHGGARGLWSKLRPEIYDLIRSPLALFNASFVLLGAPGEFRSEGRNVGSSNVDHLAGRVD